MHTQRVKSTMNFTCFPWLALIALILNETYQNVLVQKLIVRILECVVIVSEIIEDMETILLV
jgi:hypothetical protein